MGGGYPVKGKRVSLLIGMLFGTITGGVLWFGLGLGGKSFDINSFLTKNPEDAVIQLNTKVPNFYLPSLTGDKIHLNDHKGRVVIINFWATWCAPCRLEMPLFQEIYNKYYPELTVLAINVGETEKVVEVFRDDYQLTFDILLDRDRTLERQFQLRGYPTTLILDDSGALKVIHLGLLTEGQLKEYLVQEGIEN